MFYHLNGSCLRTRLPWAQRHNVCLFTACFRFSVTIIQRNNLVLNDHIFVALLFTRFQRHNKFLIFSRINWKVRSMWNGWQKERVWLIAARVFGKPVERIETDSQNCTSIQRNSQFLSEISRYSNLMVWNKISKNYKTILVSKPVSVL